MIRRIGLFSVLFIGSGVRQLIWIFHPSAGLPARLYVGEPTCSKPQVNSNHQDDENNDINQHSPIVATVFVTASIHTLVVVGVVRGSVAVGLAPGTLVEVVVPASVAERVRVGWFVVKGGALAAVVGAVVVEVELLVACPAGVSVGVLDGGREGIV
jgi:hypothetical protein